MPKKEWSLDDPMELVGVEFPTDEGGLDEMARCWVEEFIRLGYPDRVILYFFKTRFYTGPHRVYQRRGEEYVRRLIAEVRGQWCLPEERVPLTEGGDENA